MRSIVKFTVRSTARFVWLPYCVGHESWCFISDGQRWPTIADSANCTHYNQLDLKDLLDWRCKKTELLLIIGALPLNIGSSFELRIWTLQTEWFRTVLNGLEWFRSWEFEQFWTIANGPNKFRTASNRQVTELQSKQKVRNSFRKIIRGRFRESWLAFKHIKFNFKIKVVY